MKIKKLLVFISAGLLTVATGCSGEEEFSEGKPFIVTTTMMLEDAVNQIAGDFVEVYGLMGPGVDPHLYRATPGNFRRMERADLIIYNGLYLEARLAEVLGRMGDRVYAAGEILDEAQLIQAYEFGGTYDPHIWFDVSLWAQTVEGVGSRLAALIPEHEEEILQNTAAYVNELMELHAWVGEQIQTIPEQRRMLITAHDAFGYFGKAYDIEVNGLQGLSTQTEVGLQDITRMSALIMEREIPAIFLETSIAPRSIRSLINSVRDRGGQVELGGELFSDAMGERGTEKGTYTGMIRFNVTTIVEALK